MKTLEHLNIGERIDDLRRKNTPYSKTELSEKVGITASSISAYKESNNAHIRNLDKIVDVLGVTLAEFFLLPGNSLPTQKSDDDSTDPDTR